MLYNKHLVHLTLFTCTVPWESIQKEELMGQRLSKTSLIQILVLYMCGSVCELSILSSYMRLY